MSQNNYAYHVITSVETFDQTTHVKNGEELTGVEDDFLDAILFQVELGPRWSEQMLVHH